MTEQAKELPLFAQIGGCVNTHPHRRKDTIMIAEEYVQE